MLNISSGLSIHLSITKILIMFVYDHKWHIDFYYINSIIILSKSVGKHHFNDEILKG